MPRIAVIGGGPAGSVFAARMALLGHDVVLYERSLFPRPHLGESLSAGVLPLLDSVGARAVVDAEGFLPVRDIRVQWDTPPYLRNDPAARGLLVDRGRFDALLLDNARAHGVHVRQPALVRGYRSVGDCVEVDVECDGGRALATVDFVADVRGRGGVSATRRRTGRPTIALYAYWRTAELPRYPVIEAGAAGWFWGVPLPDGTYNTLAFLDPRAFHDRSSGGLDQRFRALLAGSSLMSECPDAQMIGKVQAIDATSYLDDAVTTNTIRLGDAALAIDPISSSGVQKAIQNALSGAIVVNTILRRPDAFPAASAFYRTSLGAASARHSDWASGHYRTAAATRPDAFWRARAASVDAEPAPERAPIDARSLATMRIQRSAATEFIDLPCLDAEFVAIKPALRHPRLDTPVAFVGGRAVAPLVWQLPAGLTPMEIARAWSKGRPVDRTLAIVVWLIEHGVLEPQALSNAA
jgi:flavin-dependent dehydrogenase